MKKQNKSMISMMHRLVEFCGKYKVPIRVSYLPGFIKGLVMKSPLMASFFLACDFMAGRMTKKSCLIYGLIILTCVILQAVMQNITDRLQSATGFKVFADKRMEMGDRFRKLTMGYFTEGNIGKVSSVLATDMNFIEENCMMVLEELVGLMISQGLMIAFMFFLSWQLGLTALACLLLVILFGNITTRISISHSMLKQKTAEKMTSAVLEFAEGIGIIKTFNLLGEKSKEVSESFEESSKNSIGFEMAYAPWWASVLISYGIVTALTLFVSGLLSSKGMMTNEYFLGMVLFAFDLFAPIKAYYGNIARLTVTDACLDRIESVFDKAEIVNEGKDTLMSAEDAARKGLPEISYQNVSFAYGNKEALHDISFDVQKGQMIALVGPSGGGKSTIANLLARFWDVKRGSIKIRGTDIRKVPVANLMDNISMVFQRVYLFQDSIYNNIAMGKTNATREEVIEVAKKARCYDFIMQLPDGFDTVIGEGGADLSGGEQQRISIARCMLKDAPIVILDEATASVDADNEHFIQEAISELCRGKTLIVIAHRLNTIRNASRIMVIKNGQIVESGTHEELLAKDGQYKNMVIRQNLSIKK
ncbi:ATP-binding cassette, subfamily B [Treponema bryantii]|uniref:ATP-binding cassette, subfamily B n=1 Tax=Treponema bryantii TaxID=163 RepID=A0A1H9FIG5_9SPIR|nr:ABC transporter ATP-binding protein [Treponema bryantii]SEQ37730.1 ATP-binding cassette, subfamily B [Treponema bryantii]